MGYHVCEENGIKIGTNTLERFIELYGEESGFIKYNQMQANKIKTRGPKKKIIKYCLNCQKEFEVFKSGEKREFCNKPCAVEYRISSGRTKGKSQCSLQYMINLYGEEEGTLRYNNFREKSRLGVIEHYKHNIHKNKGKTLEDICGEERAKEIKILMSKNNKNYKIQEQKRERTKHKSENENIWTIKWFINRYGEELGKSKYQERCNKLKTCTSWHEFNKTNKRNFSNISQELFWIIYEEIKNEYNEKEIYFGELNNEHCAFTSSNFDFVDLKNKKIIEFNGDGVHGNLETFKESDVLFHGKTVYEQHIHDYNKINKAIEKGFQVLVIWESEYKKDKEEVKIKCLDFLRTQQNV